MMSAYGPRIGGKKIESRRISRDNATKPIIDKIRLGLDFANFNIQCEMYFQHCHLVVKKESIILVRMTLILNQKFEK